MSEGTLLPPDGAPVLVQLLDTSYADAPARVVEETSAPAETTEGGVLQRVELAPEVDAAGDYRVRVHIDVDGDGRVSAGDFVSTASYPFHGQELLRVVVKPV